MASDGDFFNSAAIPKPPSEKPPRKKLGTDAVDLIVGVIIGMVVGLVFCLIFTGTSGMLDAWQKQNFINNAANKVVQRQNCVIIMERTGSDPWRVVGEPQCAPQ